MMDWSLLSTADCRVGVSRAASASLAEHVSTRLRVQTIYNGVPINGRGAPARNGRVRRLAVVARAERWKRIDRVVSAFGQLPSDLLERLHLDVYGHDPVAGGNANAYDYCTADPMSCYDLDGRVSTRYLRCVVGCIAAHCRNPFLRYCMDLHSLYLRFACLLYLCYRWFAPCARVAERW